MLTYQWYLIYGKSIGNPYEWLVDLGGFFIITMLILFDYLIFDRQLTSNAITSLPDRVFDSLRSIETL